MSLRNARTRSEGATCIQTALASMRSKARPVWTVCLSPGRESASHCMEGSSWRSRAMVRKRGEGSTATTS